MPPRRPTSLSRCSTGSTGRRNSTVSGALPSLPGAGMGITLADVAKFVGGEVVGDGSTELAGVAGIKEARAGELTFVSNPRYKRCVADTSASA
ncbi:MAG: hypothetical protein KAJ04_04320, partial [Candidatus Eisenbacteria sp.]|nr:hypothetical protein [Candidatus Eisenbacteria bacterium]